MHCIEEGTPFAEISLKTSKHIKLVAYITNRQLACGLGPCLSISVSCFTISSHADLSFKGKNFGKLSDVSEVCLGFQHFGQNVGAVEYWPKYIWSLAVCSKKKCTMEPFFPLHMTC